MSLFGDAGLAPDALDDPEGRVSYAAMAWILEEGARRTGCSHIGLLAGRMWQLVDHGLVGELVTRSETVHDALSRFTAHQRLNSDGGAVFLVCHGNVVDLGYAVYDPHLDATRQLYDAVLAAGFNLLRSICGPAWLPTEVLVPHARPVDVTPYDRLFKVRPRFNASAALIRFPSHWLNRRLASADPVRLAHALKDTAHLHDETLMQQAIRGVRLLLVHGCSSADDLAANLRMHRRTLNRRLKAQGTTFQQILDGVRVDVARQLLAESLLPLDDIADALGYAGVASFIRSFNRLTGTTPGRWRRAATSRSDTGGPRAHAQPGWPRTAHATAAD